MARIHTAIESFQQAALEPESWPQALDVLAHSLDSDGATLVLKHTSERSAIWSAGIHHLALPYFLEKVPDPREQRVQPTLQQAFMADYAHFTPEEIANDPYYQEFLAPRGFGWHAVAALPGGLVLSLKRRRQRGYYDDACLRVLNSALPSLRAASRTAALAWRSRFSGQLTAFETLERGALLLDAQARILEMNACVTFGDGLEMSNGALHASNSADRPRLQRFLTSFIGNRGPAMPTSGESLALARPSGLRPLLLDAIACTEAVRSLHTRAALLVLITDIERRVRPAFEVLRQLFGLTPTEAELARALMSDESLQQAAARLSISPAHARQRLQSIFAKTGTCRQGELIALLARLG